MGGCCIMPGYPALEARVPQVGKALQLHHEVLRQRAQDKREERNLGFKENAERRAQAEYEHAKAQWPMELEANKIALDQAVADLSITQRKAEEPMHRAVVAADLEDAASLAEQYPELKEQLRTPADFARLQGLSQVFMDGVKPEKPVKPPTAAPIRMQFPDGHYETFLPENREGLKDAGRRGGFPLKTGEKRGKPFVARAPDGKLYFYQMVGGGKVERVEGITPETEATGKKYTSVQRKAAGFAHRMIQAEKRMDAILKKYPDFDPAGFWERLSQSTGMAGRAISYTTGWGEAAQLYAAAANDFVRAAIRKESGAAIGIKEELEEYARFFALTGDSPAVVAQKVAARASAIRAFIGESGGFYAQQYGPQNGGETGTVDEAWDANGVRYTPNSYGVWVDENGNAYGG